jgi:hypothetical protein
VNTGDIALLAFAIVTAGWLLIVRTHSAFVIMALCAGAVLMDQIGRDVFRVINGSQAAAAGSSEFANYTQIALTFVPAFLIAFYFKGSQKKPGRFLLQLIPSLCVPILMLVFATPYLPLSLRDTLSDSRVWTIFEKNRSSIVAGVIGISIGELLFEKRRDKKDEDS